MDRELAEYTLSIDARIDTLERIVGNLESSMLSGSVCQGVTGSGTENYLAKFAAGGASVVDSIVREAAATGKIGINGTPTLYELEVHRYSTYTATTVGIFNTTNSVGSTASLAMNAFGCSSQGLTVYSSTHPSTPYAFKMSNGEGDIHLSASGDVIVGTATNHSAFEATGFWVGAGTARYYRDVQFPIETGKVPAANFPTWEAFTTNTSAYAFSVDDKIDTQTNEYPHWGLEADTWDFHAHVTIKTANATGANRFVKIQVAVAYADSAQAAYDVWAETVLTGELTVPDGSDAKQAFYLDIGNLDLSNYTIGSQIKCNIKRIAATGGTEYADDVYITQVGAHVIGDTMGSRAEITKS